MKGTILCHECLEANASDNYKPKEFISLKRHLREQHNMSQEDYQKKHGADKLVLAPVFKGKGHENRKKTALTRDLVKAPTQLALIIRPVKPEMCAGIMGAISDLLISKDLGAVESAEVINAPPKLKIF